MVEFMGRSPVSAPENVSKIPQFDIFVRENQMVGWISWQSAVVLLILLITYDQCK